MSEYNPNDNAASATNATSTGRRLAPTAAERAYAETFLPGAIKIAEPAGPSRLEVKPNITNIPIPREALQENQGQSPLDFLDHDEYAAVAVSNNMANGRVPRTSDIPSFRAPINPLKNPKFVPARMHYSILSDPKWAPPEEAKPKPMDVSTAEIVEKPLRRNAGREFLEAQRQARESDPDMQQAKFAAFAKKKRHFVAYDDNDMFPYTTKQIPLPPFDPKKVHFFEVVQNGDVYVTRTKLIVVSYDRKSAVHIPIDNDKISSEGWSLHTIRGYPPPAGCPLVIFSDEWLVGLFDTRCYSLTVDGWAWRRSIVPDMVDGISVDLADLVDDTTVYLRNSKSSRHMLIYLTQEDLDEDDITMLYREAGIDMDLRRGAQRFPKPWKKKDMRTIPSSEPISIVAGARGVALSYKPDHTWIFLYNDAAKSYLPHQRIDFVLPRAVVLPSHIYFLAVHPETKGSTTVVARMNRLPPRKELGEEEFEVKVYERPDDVVVSCPIEAIVGNGAMPESYSGTGQTAVLVSDDWRSAVVVEFDRRAKLLRLYEGEKANKKHIKVPQIMTPGT